MVNENSTSNKLKFCLTSPSYDDSLIYHFANMSMTIAAKHFVQYFTEISFSLRYLQIHPFSQIVDGANVIYGGRSDLRPPFQNYHERIVQDTTHCAVVEIDVHKFSGVQVKTKVSIVVGLCVQNTWVCHGKLNMAEIKEIDRLPGHGLIPFVV